MTTTATLVAETVPSLAHPPSPGSAPEPARLAATVRAVLAGHHDDGLGMCAACLAEAGQLKPAPCEQARWATAVTSRPGQNTSQQVAS